MVVLGQDERAEELPLAFRPLKATNTSGPTGRTIFAILQSFTEDSSRIRENFEMHLEKFVELAAKNGPKLRFHFDFD